MDKKVLYSAVVLDDISKTKILNSVQIPDGWEIICHHFTLCLGAVPEDKKYLLGKNVELIGNQIGQTDKALALKVNNFQRFMPGTSHITIAINKSAGAKPKDSNEINIWNDLGTTLYLSGNVEEITK